MLILLPNLLHEETDCSLYFPSGLNEIVTNLDGLIVENEKMGRAFLKRFSQKIEAFRHLPMALLNEHTQNPRDLLKPLLEGQSWGLISDAGLPCLADPGATLVALAKERGITVRTLAGPSSPILALQLSGLPAQRFAFNGYLPREAQPLSQAIKKLEERSKQEESTQLFIEAPYRNNKLLQQLLSQLQPQTKLCVACDLTASTQMVKTDTVANWKKVPLPDLDNRPVVFCLST